jgi:hypothetical protein
LRITGGEKRKGAKNMYLPTNPAGKKYARFAKMPDMKDKNET